MQGFFPKSKYYSTTWSDSLIWKHRCRGIALRRAAVGWMWMFNCAGSAPDAHPCTVQGSTCCHGKRDFADVIKVMTLRCRGPGVPKWALYKYPGLWNKSTFFSKFHCDREIWPWKIGHKDSILLAMKLEIGFHEPRNVEWLLKARKRQRNEFSSRASWSNAALWTFWF